MREGSCGFVSVEWLGERRRGRREREVEQSDYPMWLQCLRNRDKLKLSRQRGILA